MGVSKKRPDRREQTIGTLKKRTAIGAGLLVAEFYRDVASP